MARHLRHIACAISGGVDSAVSALLLKRKGYKLTGVFMRNWDLTNETGVCSVDADREDAKYVCKELDIPFVEVSFVKEYWNDVFIKMLESYENGTTPNPDVLCNRHVKFDAFHKYAMRQLGVDAIATGHYARTSVGYCLQNANELEGVSLLQAVDPLKDQTLFLCQMPQEALRDTLFPIGELMKTQVKQIAADAGLNKVASKRESMGLCFIGKRNFHSFLEEYIDRKPGDFIDIETGEIVGKHHGTHYWTIGQRTHIGGLHTAYFVASLDPSERTVYVVSSTDHPALFSTSLTAACPQWINKVPEELYRTGRMQCQFRYQHIHPLLDCTVRLDKSSDAITIEYDIPLRAVTVGQYAVLYHGQECLGGGQILSVGPSLYESGIRERVQFSKVFR